jgi:hypothetical protein
MALARRMTNLRTVTKIDTGPEIKDESGEPCRMRLSSAVIGLLAAGAIVGAPSPPAHAGLLGTTITLDYDYLIPAATTDTLLVGAGIEVTCTGGGSGNANVCQMLTAPNQFLDVGDLTIAYVYSGAAPAGFNPTSPNGMTLRDLNPGAPIVDVLIDTGIAGLDDTRVSFTPSSVSVYLGGLGLGTSNYFTLTLVTAPEPWSIGCLAAGLTSLIAIRRRRDRVR